MRNVFLEIGSEKLNIFSPNISVASLWTTRAVYLLLKIVILSINLVVYNYSNLTCDWRCLWKWESGSIKFLPASKFLLGAPWSEKLAHGWVHPLRFSSNQLRVIGSCSSWHPGLFKQMATCTSDIQVAFTTDSSEVALDLKN